ncbi:ATP-dependent nuclease [Endozoicomonadaceae bacterium StTr2]
MYLSNLIIKNFRNFECISIPLKKNIVLLGENRAGKSNLLHAIRLVLDSSLPDSERHLKLSDLWDGCDLSAAPQIEVHLDFADFDSDMNLAALLTDFRRACDPTVARLSYVFRKKADVAVPVTSSEDYEFVVFGGEDESYSVPSRVRRRISLDMLHALRDAEGQLASWRNSPLRPLLEDAISSVDRADLERIASDLESANDKVESLASVKELEVSLRNRISEFSCGAQDIDARLRFSPSDPTRLFRALSLFIDGGKRGIAEASLGSANVSLLALKLAEFSWLRLKNERNYSVLCIEEPEAHLHPQLQRSVFDKLFNDITSDQSLVVTSHSPTLAAVAPLNSIINLRRQGNSTKAFSLAQLPVTRDELEDLERYLTATRSEMLFARGVIFVEGDAEEALLPVFAESLGYSLDQLGITVCNVAGVNFKPYVKLATGLGLPFSVITDWDPLDGTRPPLGIQRTIGIWDAYCEASGQPLMSSDDRAQLSIVNFSTFYEFSSRMGIFLNDSTFEVAVASTPGLQNALLDILNEQGFGPTRTARIKAWRAGHQVDPIHLLAMVSDIGKGRLSTKLAKKVRNLMPPKYIIDAINFVVSNA